MRFVILSLIILTTVGMFGCVPCMTTRTCMYDDCKTAYRPADHRPLPHELDGICVDDDTWKASLAERRAAEESVTAANKAAKEATEKAAAQRQFIQHYDDTRQERLDLADCSKSSGCLEDGTCHLVDDKCQATTNKDCQRSTECKDSGKCSLVEGQCSINSNSDCRKTDECKQSGECFFLGNECVTKNYLMMSARRGAAESCHEGTLQAQVDCIFRVCVPAAQKAWQLTRQMCAFNDAGESEKGYAYWDKHHEEVKEVTELLEIVQTMAARLINQSGDVRIGRRYMAQCKSPEWARTMSNAGVSFECKGGTVLLPLRLGGG